MSSGQSFRQLVGASPSSASLSDSVLIIIDAQNEYADGKLAIKNATTSRAAIKALLERYRTAGAPIIHIVHVVPAGAPVFTPNTSLAEEFAELQADSELMITKRHPGAFTDTSLRAELDKIGRKKVVLVGYMAHVCISTTAREGYQAGYDVFVVKDAIGDRDIPGAEAETLVDIVYAELGDLFATIVQSGDIA